MTMITNIQHFLDEEGDIPELPTEALDLVTYLISIIEVATTDDEGDVELDEIQCRKLVKGRR